MSISIREGNTDVMKLIGNDKNESEKPVVSNKNAGPDGYVLAPSRKELITGMKKSSTVSSLVND